MRGIIREFKTLEQLLNSRQGDMDGKEVFPVLILAGDQSRRLFESLMSPCTTTLCITLYSSLK